MDGRTASASVDGVLAGDVYDMTDFDGDGYSSCTGDCNESSADVYWGAGCGEPDLPG